MKIKYSEIKPGQKFKYNDLEFTKLYDNLSIINTFKSCMYCAFDNIDNDYETSLVRYFINNKLLKLLNINLEDLQSLNDLGDRAILLSLEEYEQFKDIIQIFADWWWLRSPYSSSSNFARIVYYYGDCIGVNVYNRYGAVRAVFSFNPDILIELI